MRAERWLNVDHHKTRKLEIVTSGEKPRNLERSIQELVGSVRGTMKVLAARGRVPTPSKYLAVIRSIGSLKEVLNRHIEIERALLRKAPDYGLYSATLLSRIIEEHEANEKQLVSMLDAPWPRSPEAGLLALRIRIREVLRHLLTRIELKGTQLRNPPHRARRRTGLALAAVRDSGGSAS